MIFNNSQFLCLRFYSYSKFVHQKLNQHAQRSKITNNFEFNVHFNYFKVGKFGD